MWCEMVVDGVSEHGIVEMVIVEMVIVEMKVVVVRMEHVGVVVNETVDDDEIVAHA